MITMTRDRAALLRAISYGHVRHTSGGLIVWRRHGAPALRCGRRVDELVAEHLAVLGDDDTYYLTDVGDQLVARTSPERTPHA